MSTLRDRWLSLSPAGWHYVVASLAKENQFELALDHVSQMAVKDIYMENWLHNLLVYNLCEFEDFDAVLHLMRSRNNQGHDITLDLWYYVLDAASRAHHVQATRYVWRRVVELGYLHPPYGICSNVLSVASRGGDTRLAGSVLDHLGDSDIPLVAEDYERMAEAHLLAEDLQSAFGVICRMHNDGVPLHGSSTRSILTYMIETQTHPNTAWDILKQLKSMRFDIPVECANVVIEQCEMQAVHDSSMVNVGVALYKELYSLCTSGANVSTYNSLISMCRRGDNRQAAMFIVKEMSGLGVVPDDTTFEQIILACLDGGNFRSAYLYFQDLLGRGGDVSEEAGAQIRTFSSHTSDNYALLLRYHPRIRGNVVRTDRRDEDEDEPTRVISVISRNQPVRARPPSGIQTSERREPDAIKRRRERDARRQQTYKEYRKEDRKRRRKLAAVEEHAEEEGWREYEPGGLMTEAEVKAIWDDTEPSPRE